MGLASAGSGAVAGSAFGPWTAAAGAGLGLLGGLFGASGAEQAAQAQSQADMYQAQIAAYNSQIATQNAHYTMWSGETAAQNEALQDRAKTGTMTASMGANGVDVNTGSNASIRAGADSTSLLDALTIRSNAARQAYGYQVQGYGDTQQSQLDQMSAQNAQTAGTIGAATSLISGATSVARAYAPYQAAAGGFNLGTG